MITEKILGSATIHSILRDEKINAYNVSLDVTRQDYLAIADEIMTNNEFQRRNVKKPNTVYALLKDDLKEGCLIPPLVLALDDENEAPFSLNGNMEENKKNILSYIRSNYDKIRILDGLQRTNMLISVEKDLIIEDKEKLEKFYKQKMRLEFYIGVNRFGILYRMLTLNTGQTPMTIRHQIEMLYLDYYSDENEEIFLNKEADNSTKPVTIGNYKFSTMVEGLNSYIEGSELTIDRFDLLIYVQSIKKLAVERKDVDLFKRFIETYHQFMKKIDFLSDNWKFDKEDFPDNFRDNNPFSMTAAQIFTKSQVVTGFGAGISNLKKRGIIIDFEQIEGIIDKITFENSAEEGLNNLILRLDEFRKEGARIGEKQRTFFRYFFEALFNSRDENTYTNIDNSVEWAYHAIYATYDSKKRSFA